MNFEKKAIPAAPKSGLRIARTGVKHDPDGKAKAVVAKFFAKKGM